MKFKNFAVCLVTLTSLNAAPAIRIALVGDSTVNDEGGWGPGFRASFSSDVTVNNAALNGRSSKSFRDEGHWEPVLADKPNYVLLQFGHNDNPGKGPERETIPKTTYRENMARYVDEVKAAGAIPILVTSIVRRNFDGPFKLKRDALVPYVQELRKLAADKNVPLIDLYALTLAQAEKVGKAGADALGRKDEQGKQDNTHLGPRGQFEIGSMAAIEFVRLMPAMKPYWHELVSWKDAMRQPKAWYGSAEAMRIADSLLAFQFKNGAWDKNMDMSVTPALKELDKLKREGHTNIDNGATYTQMQYLARVYTAQPEPRFKQAFDRALQYLLEAQYPNGGWPQFYPLRKGYYTHITYNDDAMANVLHLLRSISDRKPEYLFVNDKDRQKAQDALQKGIECILKTQVKVNGKLTVWCAQHDEVTMAPAKARSYELPSLSGSESVGIVEFLMGVTNPSQEIIASIEGAVGWFEAVKIKGIRLERKPVDGSPKGYDLVVVPDAAAPAQWARFYDLATNKPMFCGRDGVVKSTIAEIEYERRNGYRWYVDRPARLLERAYPEWRKRN